MSREKNFFVLSFFFSALTCVWAIFNSGLVNSDGTVYLVVAEAFSQGGWDEAVKYYKKPFYSILIASLSDFARIDYLYAAYLINTVFFILASYYFSDVVRHSCCEKKENKYLLIFSVFYIALFAVWNELKGDIYKDFGFWALTLASLSFLVRYEKKDNFKFFLLSIFIQFLSGFFREEGFVFVFVHIFLLLISPSFRKRKKYNFLFVFFIFTAVLYLLLKIGFYKNFNLLFSGWDSSVKALKNGFLTKYSEENAPLILVFGAFSVVIYEVLKNLGASAFILLALCSSTKKKNNINRSVWLYFLVSIVVLFMFFVQERFLVARYVTLSSVLLSIIVLSSYYSDKFFQSRPKVILLCVLIIVLFMDSFFKFGPSRQYALEAKAWILENTDDNSTVISNKRGFSYSIRRPVDIKDMMHDNPLIEKVKEYDYYVFFSDAGDILNYPFLSEKAYFFGEKNRWVVIYKVLTE